MNNFAEAEMRNDLRGERALPSTCRTIDDHKYWGSGM
jgi:hypothetical protein